MRVNGMAFLVAATLLGGAVPTRADDKKCCNQDGAKPWKLYNTGIRWSVGLSKEPDRWESLLENGLEIRKGSSLAERAALLSTKSKRGIVADWSRGLQPALERARKEDKLVMFFQLVGDLDLEGC